MSALSTSYKESLLRRLREDKLEAVYYLDAALEDSPEALLMALKNVREAQGGTGVTNAAPIPSALGSLTLAALTDILSSLGMRLSIRPMEPAEAKAPASEQAANPAA